MAKRLLTQEVRHHIVESVMNDMPRVNYDDEIKLYINVKARAQLPVEFQADHLYEYVGEEFHHEFKFFVKNPKYVASKADINFVERQRKLQADQRIRRDSIRRRLAAALGSLEYVKDIEENLPQLTKYIPKVKRARASIQKGLSQELESMGWKSDDA